MKRDLLLVLGIVLSAASQLAIAICLVAAESHKASLTQRWR
jgi:hypothetical protein